MSEEARLAMVGGNYAAPSRGRSLSHASGRLQQRDCSRSGAPSTSQLERYQHAFHANGGGGDPARRLQRASDADIYRPKQPQPQLGARKHSWGPEDRAAPTPTPAPAHSQTRPARVMLRRTESVPERGAELQQTLNNRAHLCVDQARLPTATGSRNGWGTDRSACLSRQESSSAAETSTISRCASLETAQAPQARTARLCSSDSSSSGDGCSHPDLTSTPEPATGKPPEGSTKPPVAARCRSLSTAGECYSSESVPVPVPEPARA